MYRLEVLCPQAVSRGLLEPLESALRPATLANSTVALVWNAKRGGEIVLDRLAELFHEQGIAVKQYTGGFPCPDSLLEQATSECQGLVMSVGDCGASAAWMAHDVARVESRGSPAVGLISAGYEVEATEFAQGRGLANAAFVALPAVLSTLRQDHIRTMADEAFPKVLKSLISQPPVRAHTESPDRLLEYKADDALAAFELMNGDFLGRRWGDGLPVLPPTQQKVDAMLGVWGDRRDEVFAIVPPGEGLGTYERIAVNAVLAGCKPDHFPLVLAAVKAYSKMGQPAVRMAVSAAPLASLLVVNGPIAKDLSLNSGRCALGPGMESAANIAIGRAFRLVLMNVGLCYPGQLDTDTIGTAKKFGMCLAENEQSSPWEPFHVEKGFDEQVSTVSLFCVGSESLGTDLWNEKAEDVLRGLAFEEARPGGWYLVQAFGGEKLSEHGVLLLASPEHAEMFAREGWTKYQVKQFLWNEARTSAEHLLNKWRNLSGKVRNQWKWLTALDRQELKDLALPAFETPDHFEVVVVGGESPFDSLYGTFGAAVTVPVPTP